MAQAAEAAPLSTYHRQLLSANYGVLLDSINTGMLIPYLVQNRVLTIPEVDVVRDEKGNEKNARIISYLYRKPDAIYPNFLRSLRESKHDHVANVLEAPPNTPFDTPACVTTPAPSLSSETSLCGRMCDKGCIDLRISVSVDNCELDSPPPVALLDAGIQPALANKSPNPSGSHDVQQNQNSTLQADALKGTQSTPSHESTYKALRMGDHQPVSLGVTQQSSTFPVLVESTSYHVNSPYKSASFGDTDKYGDNNNNTTMVKKPTNSLTTGCGEAMEIDDPGATALCRPVLEVRNNQFQTGPYYSENHPPETTQYPHNYAVEGSNFAQVGNTVTRSCPSSPDCECTACLEAQILQTLKIANKKLQMAVISGNGEEASNLTKVIDRCFDWLNFLKTRGIDNYDVHLGCVILNFNCESPEALDILWKRWITGQLTSELQAIFLPLFEMQYPNSKVSIVTKMCSHQYLRYWKKLAAEKALRTLSSLSTRSPIPSSSTTAVVEREDAKPDGSPQDMQIESDICTPVGGDAFSDIVETLDRLQGNSQRTQALGIIEITRLELRDLLIRHRHISEEGETASDWRCVFNELYDFYGRAFGCKPESSMLSERSKYPEISEVGGFIRNIMHRMKKVQGTPEDVECVNRPT